MEQSLKLSPEDKKILKDYILDIKNHKVSGIISREDLWNMMNNECKYVVEKILNLNPTNYGFKGPKINDTSIGSNIIKLPKTSDINQGEYTLDNNSYLPEHILVNFEKMNNEFKLSYPGRELLIGSGYRSPAFQIITLVYILVEIYDFDISETLKRVALPEYSQHCSLSHTALDILNIDGLPSDEDPIEFSKTIEYKWLKDNANTFGFNESYPKGNPYGIMWEPWHWQFLPG
jgi:D-alanyl-D-alanine carboxypeptidase